MLTPPADLSGGDLGRVIDQAWGVAVDSLEYLPIGFGSHHWVATDGLGLRHFVTADELSSESRRGDEVSALGLHLRSALAAAADLCAVGCDFVVAPIATRANDPFVRLDRYAVALYPFIEGRRFDVADSFDEVDREGVLDMVATLHRVPTAAIRPPPTDGFVVPWLDQLDGSMHREVAVTGPYAATASELLIDHEVELRRLIARYRALVARYVSDPGPVVITHGEIHPGNVMATSEGWVIVDWDTVLLAPPERDLWRLAADGGPGLRGYVEATGTAPKEWLLGLYGIRWDLAEAASFAAEFRKPHEDTEDTRKALAILRAVVGRLRT